MKNSHFTTGIPKLEAENCWYWEVVKSLSLSLLKVCWELVKLLLLGCWVIGEEALFSETYSQPYDLVAVWPLLCKIYSGRSRTSSVFPLKWFIVFTVNQGVCDSAMPTES